jgi:hypothetical protein
VVLFLAKRIISLLEESWKIFYEFIHKYFWLLYFNFHFWILKIHMFSGDSQTKLNSLIRFSFSISLYLFNRYFLLNCLLPFNTIFFLSQKHYILYNNHQKTHELYQFLLYSFYFSLTPNWNSPHIFHKVLLLKNK